MSTVLLVVLLASSLVIGWMGHFPRATFSEVERHATAALAFVVGMSAVLGIIWLG